MPTRHGREVVLWLRTCSKKWLRTGRIPCVSASIGILRRLCAKDSFTTGHVWIRIEAEGFVTIQPRKGVYITPVSDAFVKSACQILGALEADCLDTVFPLLTSRHIRQLEESNKRQEQFLERRQAVEYHAENARFHDIFLSLSSNTLLYQTIGPLRRRLDMLPDHPLAYEQARAALNDHCRIIDSLKMKNRTAAVSVLRHEHWAPVRFLCPKSAKLSRVASSAAKRSAA